MQLPLTFPDLPPVRVRVSARARRASLSVCRLDGIVLTLPRRFDQRQVPALLAEWQPWLQRQLQRLAAEHEARPELSPQVLPARIRLPAVDGSWEVAYAPPGKAGSVRVREAKEYLELHGATGNADLCRSALQRWLARQARAALAPLARRLAEQHGFSFQRLNIRAQRTRWGSCSSSGTISLNQHLLFLAPELVRCVVLHELCHTRWMNHGPRFQALLRRLEPECAALDERIHAGWREIPGWAWRR